MIMKEQYNWIESMITAFYYNRDNDDVVSMIQGTINRILNKSYDEQNAGDDDTDLLMSAIVMQYGDYGTSPRFGWISENHKGSVLLVLCDQLNYYKKLCEVTT